MSYNNKRGRSASPGNRKRQTRSSSSSASSHWRFPEGHPMARKGYGSVARSRGATVTGEMKYYDSNRTAVDITAVSSDWTGTVQDPSFMIVPGGGAGTANPNTMFAPIVGSAINQRVGRSVKVLKWKIRGRIQWQTQTTQTILDNVGITRLVFGVDTQTNGVQADGTAVFNASSGGNTTVHSMQTPNNFGRFKIYHDKTYKLENGTAVNNASASTISNGGGVVPFKFTKKWSKPLIVHFNEVNGGTVADVINYSFHCWVACSNSTLQPQIIYYSRINFKE